MSRAPEPYRNALHDGPARPGVPVATAWACMCAMCSHKIAGAQSTIWRGLRVCRDRAACADRRKAR